jgi:hypothetical protein
MTTEVSSFDVFVDIPKDFLIPQHQQNATESTASRYSRQVLHNETSFQERIDSVTVSILSGLLVFLSFFLFMILVYILMKQRIRGNQSSRQSGEEHQVGKDEEERILYRYETIEHWLITKRAQKHDDSCTVVVCGIIPQSHSAKDVEVGATAADSNCACCPVKDVEVGDTAADSNCACCPVKVLVTPEQQASPNTFNTDRDDDDSLFNDEDNGKECPICMNTFCEGDIVSWSANEKCSHVYHHECIKEWMLRRTECPCCRGTFLACDDILVDDKTEEELEEMSERYKSRSSATFYCLHEGLISLPPVVRCTPNEKKELKKRIFDSTVKREELLSLRGERQDATATVDKECGLQVEGSGTDPSEWCEEEEEEEIVFGNYPVDTYSYHYLTRNLP